MREFCSTKKDGLALSLFIFDDSASESLNGLIYLPSRNLTINSTSNMSSAPLALIAGVAVFNTVNWNLSGSDVWSIQNACGSGAPLTQ